MREALRGLKWMTPQGEKTIRAGDHQAVQTMYVVRITNGQFKIGGEVSGRGRRRPGRLHAVLSASATARWPRATVMTEVLDYIEFVLAPQVVTGLAFGVAVILVAIGLTIIFGLLDVINMSHGEFYAFGAFGALALGWLGAPVLAAAGPGAAGDAPGRLCGRARADPARVQPAGPPRHDAAADLRARARARGCLPARLRPQPLPPGNADSAARSSCSASSFRTTACS